MPQQGKAVAPKNSIKKRAVARTSESTTRSGFVFFLVRATALFLSFTTVR